MSPNILASEPTHIFYADESLKEMENKMMFSTRNHPIEMYRYVPMIYFRGTGFHFEITTSSGKDVKGNFLGFSGKRLISKFRCKKYSRIEIQKQKGPNGFQTLNS